MAIPNCMTIAGSDPSGGAGLQADLKTFQAHGCYGTAVVTALTAQNTHGVRAVHQPPAPFVAEQIAAVVDDVAIAALKTGMLGDAAVVSAVVTAIADAGIAHVVVDPVLVATSGDRLLASEAEATLRHELLPLASVLTPNLPEAAALLGSDLATVTADRPTAARALADLGPAAVYLKGGHADGDVCEDLLWDGAELHQFRAPRQQTTSTHGTGCTLAAAITAQLARGVGLVAAATAAHAWLQAAITAAEQLAVGSGHGPVHHGHALRV